MEAAELPSLETKDIEENNEESKIINKIYDKNYYNINSKEVICP